MKLTLPHIEKAVKNLLVKYNAESAIIFGSYARGEETDTSDVDIIVFGGNNFRLKDIFAFGEDLREELNISVDCFEISEVDTSSAFYENVLTEGIRVA